MKNIAVLGLGKMGKGIASRLLEADYSVIVWNRTKSKAQSLLDRGAAWAKSPSDAALKSDTLISMVSDDEASTEVWLGNEGAMHKMKPGSMMIECSTVSFSHVIHLAGEAKDRGFQYIDCPVTGWPEHAAAGTVTLLVGADKNAFASAKEYLNAFSKNIFYFGDVGKGTAYKLLINLMGAVQIAGLAEAVCFADKLGLDRELVINAIETSVAGSPQVIKNVRTMAERNFESDPPFTIGLRRKDTEYAVSLAKHFACKTPLGIAALQWFQKAAMDNPARDQASVIDVME